MPANRRISVSTPFPVFQEIYSDCGTVAARRPQRDDQNLQFLRYLQEVQQWSRWDSNPRPPPCKVRASYTAGYRLMSEIRFSEPDTALDGPCKCRQMSSATAPTAATLLPFAAHI